MRILDQFGRVGEQTCVGAEGALNVLFVSEPDPSDSGVMKPVFSCHKERGMLLENMALIVRNDESNET